MQPTIPSKYYCYSCYYHVFSGHGVSAQDADCNKGECKPGDEEERLVASDYRQALHAFHRLDDVA